MNNNKKPSEPAKEERWVKIEKEVQELKRSRSILSIGLFLLSGLYGILILCIILRIIRIEDTLTSIIQFNALVGEHLQSLGDSLIRMCARRLGYKSANSFASAVSHGLSGSHRTYKYTFARERIDRSEVDSLPPVRTIRKKPAGAPTPTSCKGW